MLSLKIGLVTKLHSRGLDTKCSSQGPPPNAPDGQLAEINTLFRMSLLSRLFKLMHYEFWIRNEPFNQRIKA